MMKRADFGELSDAEKEHFYRCSKCGQFVDKRELRHRLLVDEFGYFG
jgi:hypothetical protein